MHRVVLVAPSIGSDPESRPTVTVRLVGEIDAVATARLALVLVDACDIGAQALEVDLQEVTSLDASSLAGLRQARRAAEERGVAFRVMGAARAVGRQLLWADLAHALPPAAGATTARAGLT